ncbi:MAG: hypothetical protein KKD39_03035, partial [Candidatus Altiarchaeota archaeon]|nr:hypothetical protein [Candidatus Altiarchaeota archaeon]
MAAPGTVQPVNPTTKADTRQLDNAVPPIDEHTKRERERFLRELEMKGSKATYDRLKEHIGRMDADSIRRVQGHVDTGAQSGNVQGLNDALHGFADMLDGAHRRGGGDDRRFNKIFQVEFDAMETDQADRLRRMGIEVNAETMFFAMVQTMSSPGWGQYRKFLEKISAETLKSHDAARMMMNGALVAAVLLDNELEKRKKQK